MSAVPTSRVMSVTVLLLGIASLRAGTDAPAGSEAEGDIRKVLETQVAAWNKGDLDGFMAGYWKSKDLFFISGAKSVQGWDALKDRYDKAYRGEGKEMGKLEFSEIHVENVGPASALVRGKWKVTMKVETVEGWFTLIFRKMPEGWKITHDHTSK